MDLTHYRSSIVLSTHRLKKLIADRDKLELEIERTGEYIKANANFLPDAEREAQLKKLEQLIAQPPGFTDAVRIVLSKNQGYSTTAIGVRELLVKSGFPLSGYSNPLASIHTILKRLADRGEVDTETVGGEMYYHWKGDDERSRRIKAMDDPTNPLYVSGMRDFPKKK
jgi:hypothetical protein